MQTALLYSSSSYSSALSQLAAFARPLSALALMGTPNVLGNRGAHRAPPPQPCRPRAADGSNAASATKRSTQADTQHEPPHGFVEALTSNSATRAFERRPLPSAALPGHSAALPKLPADAPDTINRLHAQRAPQNASSVTLPHATDALYLHKAEDVALPLTTQDDVDAFPDIQSVEGYVHSTESFSAVDGPGMRLLVFAQGCAFRCKFCCNPDTWAVKRGPVMTSKDVATQLDRELPYLKMSGGGITCSGGEAMLQPVFVAACFQEAKARGLNTCLDTTGQGTKHRHWDVVLPHTDLVLFCVKHLHPDVYAYLTGHPQGNMLRFAEELDRRNMPTWVRYVLIPDLTNSQEDLARLVAFVKQHRNILGVELLPYHTLGVDKWHVMGLRYPLEGQRACTPHEVQAAVEQVKSAGIAVMCDVPQQ